jgi:hypothetical protein
MLFVCILSHVSLVYSLLIQLYGFVSLLYTAPFDTLYVLVIAFAF